MSFVSSRMSRMKASRVSLRCSISRRRNSHSPVSSGLVNVTLASIDLQPSGRDHDLAFGFEWLALHSGDSSRVLVLCRWKEDGHKTLGNHVKDSLLVIIE